MTKWDEAGTQESPSFPYLKLFEAVGLGYPPQPLDKPQHVVTLSKTPKSFENVL